MQQLGYTDAIFCNLESTITPQHIGFMGIYDPTTADGGVVHCTDVLANVAQRLRTLPFFRTRLLQVPGRLDRPYWVLDDDFDVDYHMRQIALPQPGGWRQLCTQVATLHAAPMDLKRPLWEWTVIEGLDTVEGCPVGSFAIYIKFHHSIVDGDRAQKVFTGLHDLEPRPSESESRNESTIEAERITGDYELPPMGGAGLVSRAVTSKMKNALPYVRGATKVAAELAGTMIKVTKKELPFLSLGPRTRFDEPVGPHRVFEAAEFSLAEIKAINKATTTATRKITVNDVCVTICSGAMRKYLEFHGELPEGSVVGNLPVNMRKRGTITNENNLVASMMTYIYTDIADPVARLYRINQEINEAKKLIGTPLSHPFKIGGLLPPYMMRPIANLYNQAGLTRFLPVGTPTVITNVPGPREELYVCGARLKKIYLLGLLTPGVGLFHAIFSLGDTLTITVLADRDQMPDPVFYRECLEESYTELKAAVKNGVGDK